MGHDVKLIPPAYVAPFVKRGKTDAGDAEAISEAVTRKTMRLRPDQDCRAAGGRDDAKNACVVGPPTNSKRSMPCARI